MTTEPSSAVVGEPRKGRRAVRPRRPVGLLALVPAVEVAAVSASPSTGCHMATGTWTSRPKSNDRERYAIFVVVVVDVTCFSLVPIAEEAERDNDGADHPACASRVGVNAETESPPAVIRANADAATDDKNDVRFIAQLDEEGLRLLFSAVAKKTKLVLQSPRRNENNGHQQQ